MRNSRIYTCLRQAETLNDSEAHEAAVVHPIVAGSHVALPIAVNAEGVPLGDIGPGLVRSSDALNRANDLRPLVRRPHGARAGDGSVAPGARVRPCRRPGPRHYC